MSTKLPDCPCYGHLRSSAWGHRNSSCCRTVSRAAGREKTPLGQRDMALLPCMCRAVPGRESLPAPLPEGGLRKCPFAGGCEVPYLASLHVLPRSVGIVSVPSFHLHLLALGCHQQPQTIFFPLSMEGTHSLDGGHAHTTHAVLVWAGLGRAGGRARLCSCYLFCPGPGPKT